MDIKVALLYAVMFTIWGSTWMAIKLGLEDLPPFLFAGLRFVIAALFLGIILKLQNFPLKLKRDEIKPVIFLSIFMIALPYGLVFWGEQYTNSAMGAVLMCALPLFIFPISYIMKSDERLSVVKLCGVVLGLIGIMVIFFPKLKISSATIKGDVAILASVIIYAIAAVYLKKHADHISTRKCVFYQLLFGAPFLLAAGFIFESPQAFFTGLKNLKALACLLYLAIFGSVITFTIYYWLIKKIGNVASASVVFIEVLLAVLLDWLILSVVPHTYTWLGIALIFAGVWLVMVYGREKSRFIRDFGT